MYHTAETERYDDETMSQARWCASYRRVKLLRGVYPTRSCGAKSKSLLVSGCFKRENQENPFRGEHIYQEKKIFE